MPKSIALVLTTLVFAVLSRGAIALELEDCRISAGDAFPGIKARCGRIERQENPDDPESPLLEIRVAVVPALNLQPQTDPIVPLAGGPGQGAIQFYSAYAAAFEPVRRNRDILLVDQRGTGSSSRMDCDVDDSLIEGQFSVEKTVEFMNDCLEALPHDPRFFTTSVAVHDLEVIREALGYGQLNLYGVSYGSRVAQHFAKRYPGSTRTIIVDGVVPPQLALGPDIALESQKAIDNIFARCAADTACNDRFGDLAVGFAELVANLEENPARVSVAHPVTGKVDRLRFGRDELAGAVRLLAYSPNTIAMVPLLVSEAIDGNYRPLAAQFQMTVMNMSEALALGMHNAVMCTEDAPFYNPEAFDNNALSASFMGPVQIEALQAICSVWPAGPIDDDFKQPLSTDIPTLLLSGTADPITPPNYADMAARNLRKAWTINGTYQGHGQIAVGCMPRIIERFVDEQALVDGSADCFRSSFVMPFFLDFTGPTP
jgi:pimeloyl-ACP methyl ester carboxylesterase